MLNESERISSAIEELRGRIAQMDQGINGNIDYKHDVCLNPRLEAIKADLSTQIETHDAHMELLAWSLYRKEGEDPLDTKKRFFRELPSATGSERLLQLGCAKLLHEFDALCKDHDLRYWAAGGTLIGAVRHQGFIPWDDDVDLCMLRDEIIRLVSVVQQYPRFRLSIVYDSYAVCRQIRFMYADQIIPCFLDIFIFDYAANTDPKTADQQEEIREHLRNEALHSEDFQEWRSRGYMSSFDEGSKEVKDLFDMYVDLARSKNLISDVERGDAIIRALDNFDDPNGHRWMCSLEEIFPTVAGSFEGGPCMLPNNYERFLQEAYGDIYTLPDDIVSHFEHVPHETMEKAVTQDAIRNLLAEDSESLRE